MNAIATMRIARTRAPLWGLGQSPAIPPKNGVSITGLFQAKNGMTKGAARGAAPLRYFIAKPA